MSRESRGVAVLVADPDERALESAGEVLTADGRTVFLAASAAAGLEVVRTRPVEAVLATLALPVTGGGPFLARVAATAPVAGRVILAPVSEAGAVTDLLFRGTAQRFLASPWDPTLLRQAVSDVLQVVNPEPAVVMAEHTILLAEDSSLSRRILAGRLRSRHLVVEAEDGSSVLALARDRRPDLVIASSRLRGVSVGDLPGLLLGLGLSCPVLIHGDPASLDESTRGTLERQVVGVHPSLEEVLTAANILLAPPPRVRHTRAPRQPRTRRGPSRQQGHH